MMSRCRTAYLIVGVAVLWSTRISAGEPGATSETPGAVGRSEKSLRRPIALAPTADARYLLLANQRSGSVSIVDLSRKAVASEIVAGDRLSALVSLKDRRQWLALDEAKHEIVCIKPVDEGDLSAGLQVAWRIAAPPFPVDVAVSADGRRFFVSSLWTRRISAFELSSDGQPAGEAKLLDLPFAPRKLLLVKNDSKLIVGDAFGGRLGVVNVASGAEAPSLESVREFPAHNIRGLRLSLSGEMLLVSHQMLNELAHTVPNDVHWGLLMSNDLRWIKLDGLLSKDADLYAGAHMHPLGEAGNATSDPADLAVSTGGETAGLTAIALSGVGQVAIGREDDFRLSRLAVGKRPTALLFSDDGAMLYVANTFGDSLSAIDVAAHETVAEISLGPTRELTQVERGELLFYDGALSHDGWMSCHSCHTDGHSNGQLNDNFGDSSFGAPKRVLSLLGIQGTAPFAWDATATDLPAQIKKSLAHTMQGDRELTAAEMADLVAYVESLPSPPKLDELRGVADTAAIARGEQVFAKRECASCHAPPTFTTPATYDVGLRDKQGKTHFNPPSLLGVGQRGPYFHDGSAKELSDVFQTFRHPSDSTFEEQEIADLLAYLRSL